MTRTASPPQRVVSLVPSTTGTLFDLGLGESVIGVTEFCIYPEQSVAHLPKLGGTKNPSIDEIVALEPDLVFMNQEENTEAAVRALQARDIPIHLSFPRNVAESLTMLYNIAEVYASESVRQQVADLEQSLAAAAPGPQPPWRTFVPIWEGRSGEIDWWMTINQDTYTHDILAQAGFANVFATRPRRYPLAADVGTAQPDAAEGRDTRYPRVPQSEIQVNQPEVILLPTEPYEYRQADIQRIRQAFASTPAAVNGQVHLVDGSWLTWPGTRMFEALQGLRGLTTELAG